MYSNMDWFAIPIGFAERRLILGVFFLLKLIILKFRNIFEMLVKVCSENQNWAPNCRMKYAKIAPSCILHAAVVIIVCEADSWMDYDRTENPFPYEWMDGWNRCAWHFPSMCTTFFLLYLPSSFALYWLFICLAVYFSFLGRQTAFSCYRSQLEHSNLSLVGKFLLHTLTP